jgi:hypothetical protein
MSLPQPQQQQQEPIDQKRIILKKVLKIQKLASEEEDHIHQTQLQLWNELIRLRERELQLVKVLEQVDRTLKEWGTECG